MRDAIDATEEILRVIVRGDGYVSPHSLLDLIRARDAEVRADERAKVLAGFTEVHTLAWDGDPSMSGAPHRCSTAAEVDLETARLALSTVGRRKPNPRIERRLVGPWQPVADEGGAS